MSTGELFRPTKLEICRFLQSGRVVCLQSLFLCRVVARQVPAACRAAMLPRASVATMPRARLHSRGPSTSPCSAARSFDIGGSPSCSTEDKFRCFHAVVCLGRNRDAASRTAFHSIIPKQFFSSTLILANSPLSEPVIHSS